MRRFIRHGTILLFMVMLTGICWHVPSTIADQGRKTVLVLHSYHKEAWTDSLLEGIHSVLDEVAGVDLVVEYMDTKRLKTEAYYRLLDEVYRLKYGNTAFDVILTTDDNAYRYALNHQADLFKQAAIVFCGVNRFEPKEIEGNSRVTGVVEKGDFKDTLDLATAIHPDAATVHVIMDHTRTADINKEGFLKVLNRDHPDLKVSYLIDLSLNELSSRLAALPPKDFAFFIAYWLDKDGQPVTPDQLATAFHRSSIPIYGRSEWMINRGMTGGKCVSGFHQGQAAARLASRILAGENVADIPVILDSPNRFMFDYRQLERYGIDPERLPPDSILYNRPDPTFYVRYRRLIWSVATALAVLTSLVLALSITIATRRKAEKALKESETRFRTLVENAADAIFLSDMQGNLVDVNRQACDSLGYTREALLACHLKDIGAGYESQERLDDQWAELSPGHPIAIESVHRRSDGTCFPVLLRVGLLEINGDRFILGLAHDISERKQMETELRDSEARYRHLVQYAPAGIYELDLERLRFLSVNDVMCQYTGYSEMEFLEMNPLDLFAGKSAERFTRRLAELTPNDQAPPPIEYQIRIKNGRTMRAMINARFVFKNGKPVKATAVAHDVTDLRKAEAEKKRLEAKLAQVQKMESLGTLAGGIAHDFNNLLMGIQGNASLMLMDDDRSRDDQERLSNIENFVRRGVELTRQLLGLARGGKYEVKTTDLNLLVRESADLFSRTRKEIKIHHRPQDGLWCVACDRGQIHQVLLNMFINAWQAMPDGGDLWVATANADLDENFVKPHGVPAGRYVKISVTDTGIGMTPVTMAKIFDPFFTTKARSHGTGLGLASAYGIIKNHDGIIDVSSRIGEGSTFAIYLPAVEMAVCRDAPAASGLLTGSECILLVDDESMVLEVGRQMMEKLGYRVISARSGAGAVDRFRQSAAEIDMVVLDMIMPDMSGAETFKQLKAIDPQVRVLLSSGYSIDGQATSILDLGCRGFIQKPFNVQSLSQKIREVLDQA